MLSPSLDLENIESSGNSQPSRVLHRELIISSAHSFDWRKAVLLREWFPMICSWSRYFKYSLIHVISLINFARVVSLQLHHLYFLSAQSVLGQSGHQEQASQLFCSCISGEQEWTSGYETTVRQVPPGQTDPVPSQHRPHHCEYTTARLLITWLNGPRLYY